MKELIIAEFKDVDSEFPSNISTDMALSNCIKAKSSALAKGDFNAAGQAAKAAAECYRRIGFSDKAINEQQTAFALFKETGNRSGALWTKWANGNLLKQECEYTIAIPVFRTTYIHALSIKDYHCAAYSYAGLAETTRIQGFYQPSFAQHLYALKTFRSLKDYRGIVWAYGGLAQMYKNCGKLRNAFELFDISRTIAEESSNMLGLGYALRGVGEVQGFGNSILKGMHHLNIALSIFRLKRLPQGEAYVQKSLGDINLRREYIELSIQSYQNALGLFRQINDQRGIAFTLKGMGDVQRRLGLFDEAIDLYRNCYTFFKAKGIEYGVQISSIALASLGVIDRKSWEKPDSSTISFFNNY